ncbi:LacI family DNA-binding transcriptional regulator [Alicycliphilus denitrificans]|uniref:Transcriptional regulator, LacI family n=2 Tax=Alicycliphilus denitrificans TaxID=179636 RepID=F4G5V5_ALIDK|nr:LacI family DNA-binding transcriptional regulator [Alicycliphilus denitrificans]ADV00391.1 periplasmic binding protein/LacI transcriptional regulator [Alicycliphilus denitrificans BC]AEB85362.1 transcriptional regulator, LacI family [Alicycliphilus denitrificans K601]QKD43829.1 LacI family DNA-binding transcriptional regulator [Alicycliphilus denitrificans]GAO22875.1 LacI family transcriptional regulator [Alicycliphilus sp. B1]
MTANRRQRRSSGRITLNDVAGAAGVSPITVSRTLRGERSVDPVLAQRVREAAERLGYVPDPAARALASQRSTQVLVLVPLLSNALFVDLLEAVHRTLFPEGFQPLIGVTHYDSAEEELLLRTYLPHRPAGLLVTGFDRSEAARQLIVRSGVPCVHLMETSTAPGVACVGFSQQAAGATITRHLLERGRRRIAFCGAQLDPRVLQRAEGYRSTLREAGLYDPRLEMLSPERSSIALGARLFEDMVQRMPDIDAIFFCNDDIAQGGLLAANRLQIAVPGRIAIAGFNDLAGSAQMVPPLTTIRTPRGEVGQAGATMLLGLMRGTLEQPQCIDLDYELIVREST